MMEHLYHDQHDQHDQHHGDTMSRKMRIVDAARLTLCVDWQVPLYSLPRAFSAEDRASARSVSRVSRPTVSVKVLTSTSWSF